MSEPTPDVLGRPEPTPPGRSASGHGFGEEGGADPVEAGRKGGQIKAARASLAQALEEELLENRGDLRGLAQALIAKGMSGSVEALKVILDRIDGPTSLGIDAFVGQDRVVMLRVGADGAPLPGYDQPPALPAELADMADEGQAAAFDAAREAEVLDAGQPRGQLERAEPRKPLEELGLGETDEAARDEAEHDPGWRPSIGEGG